MEDGGEAIDLFLEQRFYRFDRDIAAGEAGAAGGDDGIDLRIGDPAFQRGGDGCSIVLHDGAGGEVMPCARDARGERIARGVVGFIARVGDGEDRDVHRHEGDGFVDGHLEVLCHLFSVIPGEHRALRDVREGDPGVRYRNDFSAWVPFPSCRLRGVRPGMTTTGLTAISDHRIFNSRALAAMA